MGSLFGSGSQAGARAQAQATREGMAMYRKGVDEAKEQILPGFERARQQNLFRTGQAMDALSGTMQPQLDAYSQGNLNAQQALAGSGQQMQNAILGGQVDYSGLQPQGINFDAQSYLSGMPSINAQAPDMPERDIGVQEPDFSAKRTINQLRYDEDGNKRPSWDRYFILPSNSGGNVPSRRSAWGTGIYTERK